MPGEGIQKVLFYTQIADLYVKLFLYIAILVLVVVLIKYFVQRKNLELMRHKKMMSEDIVERKVVSTEPIREDYFAVNDEEKNE